MKPTQPSSAYLWFDLEYSCLELDKAYPLQIALMATDVHLKRLLPAEEDINVVVQLPEHIQPSAWVQENLPDLVTQCRSAAAVPIQRLDEQLANYVTRAVGATKSEMGQRPVLAGNSVHADWCLALRFFPTFLSKLHYRHLDVTAMKLQWMDWFGGQEFDKENLENIKKFFPGHDVRMASKRHDAYYDVQASVAELNFYRTQLRKGHAEAWPSTNDSLEGRASARPK